jgi:ATP-dependent DNA helicase RecG
MDRSEAIKAIHQPESHEDIERARLRLKYQEAFVLQAVLEFRRQKRRTLSAIARKPKKHALRESFDLSLPFTLTQGQIEIGQEIEKDLRGTSPMMRLLQGDVGSGKTIVALRAMLDVVESGGQAVLLAPTEVLAAQHFESLTSLLGGLSDSGSDTVTPSKGLDPKVKTTLLTGSLSLPARKQALLDIASGNSHIVVGTHALIQDHVDFFDLGLVVVDEQHRFGVEQRAALMSKGSQGARPHLLVMTATPIPRTTALTVFGDLDISTLTEVPSMRAAVDTYIVSPQINPSHAARVWERMQEEVIAGNRVFIVCASISDSAGDLDEDPESSQLPDIAGESRDHIVSVEQSLIELAQRFPAVRFAGLHGKMKPEEKRTVMKRFRSNEADAIDVLIATTVIEVGVDIAEATMMIINNAERFGISQLHQLRGRIGRGDKPGLCILMQERLMNPVAQKRLEAVASTRDGFELAQRDLELRGEGDVLGLEQSGAATSLRLLRVIEDVALIESVRQEVDALARTDHWSQTIAAIELAEFIRVDQLEKT